MTGERVLLLSKRDVWSQHAARIVQVAFPGARWCPGTRGEPAPFEVAASPDYLFSFLSPWIVPAAVLERCKIAINFHPGSAHYPGIGCYNFALYEGAAEYGAVAHHMAPAVDAGDLIEERVFPLFANDTVETLKLRTMVVLLALFHDVVAGLAAGLPLPSTDARWLRRPFMRRELDALTVIGADMAPAEIARRVRATTYPGFPGAAVELGGVRFAAPVPDREPLA